MDADVWREAKGVLAEALLCPLNVRDAWVVERCPDPLLRREVQAYLHQYDEKFLETVLTVSNTFDLVTPSEAAQAPDVHPGEAIGPYVVIERLGVGGMGQVFLGNDTRLHRKVALKCLIASAAGGDLRSRILHEARAAARINHPNIAIVHDVVDHGGRPFLVMEYVEGENLAVLLRRERPPIEQVLQMGRQLASALVAAHAKGIIHRDLKPANIQVMPGGAVKILDFGVAQAMSMLSSESTPGTIASLTSLSTVATVRGDKGALMHPGTPAYMSPEQMFGKAIDQRSDIYSLGVVLYEMVTGHRPYAAEDPLDVVLALSRQLWRSTDVEVNLPPEVHDVIAKMLAINVEERYQTAAELETALVALIAPDPAMALTRPSMRSRLQVFVRVAVALVTVPVAATVLGFMTSTWFNFIFDRNPPFSNESATVWLELGLRSFVEPALVVLGVLLVFGGLKFVLRLLTLSRRVDSLLTASRTQTRRLSSRLNLDNPAVTAQAVAAIGFLALALVLWRFWEFLDAVVMPMSTYPDLQSQLSQLRPHHLEAAGWFRTALEIIEIVLGMSMLGILRLRARQAVRQGSGALALVIALFVLTALIATMPYRLVRHSDFERIAVGPDRCYAIGESDVELLAFCPDMSAPRVRKMDRNSPLVKRSGQIESIFTPLEPLR